MDVYYCFYDKKKEQKEKIAHQIGYGLLFYGLKKRYGIEQVPKIEKGKYGKPYLYDYPQIYFNISHCNGAAVCIIAEYEIGIDIEGKRRVTQALVQKALTEREKKDFSCYQAEDVEMGFLQYWTLKESFIKAIGRGLSFPLCEVEFYLKQDQRFLQFLQLSKEQKPFYFQKQIHLIASNQKKWQFLQTVLGEHYLLSICFPNQEGIYTTCKLQEVKSSNFFNRENTI